MIITWIIWFSSETTSQSSVLHSQSQSTGTRAPSSSLSTSSTRPPSLSLSFPSPLSSSPTTLPCSYLRPGSPITGGVSSSPVIHFIVWSSFILLRGGLRFRRVCFWRLLNCWVISFLTKFFIGLTWFSFVFTLSCRFSFSFERVIFPQTFWGSGRWFAWFLSFRLEKDDCLELIKISGFSSFIIMRWKLFQTFHWCSYPYTWDVSSFETHWDSPTSK